MRRKNLRAGDLAREICRKENLSYERVSYLAEALLCRFAKGWSDALKGANNETLEEIIKQKQEIRRRYIEIVTGVTHYSDEEYEDFIWDVVRSRWFMDKADMILDNIELMVDGEVTGTPYSPRNNGEKRREGKQLRTILKLSYLNGENRVMDMREVCMEMGISDTTYKRRHPDAVVLFGILMWIYANRREREDINAGIVDKPPYFDDDSKKAC